MWTSSNSSLSQQQQQPACPPGTPVAQCATAAEPAPAGPGQLILVGLLVTLILVSVIGNCLVCVAIFTDRRLRKLGNAFIVSLAIADLFVSCLVMTFALCNDLMNRWIFGAWFCDVWISFDIMCCTASILNLCAISLDRFLHIKDCLLYNQLMTRRVAVSAVMLIWFISGLVSFVPINLGWHKPAAGGGGQLSRPLEAPPARLQHQGGPPATLMAGPSQPPDLPNGGGGGGGRMGSKLDYLQRRQLEPIEKQSSPLVVDSGAGYPVAQWPAGAFQEPLHATAPTTEDGAIQFNQVESNPLDRSQIIGGPHQRHTTGNSGHLRRHLELAAVESTRLGEHLRNAEHPAPPPEPPPPGHRTSGAHHQPQTPDSLAPGAAPQQCVLALTPTYAVVSSTISFCIPCIIMLALYTKLFACARKHVRNIQAFTKAPAPIPAAPATNTTDTCLLDAEPSADAAAAAAQSPYRATRTWLKLGMRAPADAATTTTTCTASAGPVPVPEAQRGGVSPESRPFLAASQGAPCKPSQTHLQHHLQQPHHHQQHLHQPPVSQGQGSQLATHKAAVTLGIIMGTFLFCWVPFFCLNIIKAFCVDCIPSSLFRAFTWLGYANSALNPIIYGIHNTEFRNAFSCIFFRHLNLRKNGAPQAPDSHHQLNSAKPATIKKRLSGSLQLRHHRKRLTAFRQTSAPHNSASLYGSGGSGAAARKQAREPPEQPHRAVQLQLQLNEAHNQCSTSPDL